ncbi:MAG: hypothetical protein RLZZ136_1678, partial [Pseudomonadota bacterium]
MSEMTKRQEWARSWPLPVIAMLGITGPAAYSYSSGIFMGEITQEFGWTKTQFSSALTLQMLLGLVIAPLAARVLDRVGSRRILLCGIVPFACGLSLLGLANGAIWQWLLLAAFYTLFTAGVIPAAWVSGVVQSFDRSRGLALSVCLAGIGFATASWPYVVGRLVSTIGWRLTFPAMAAGWALILLPITFFFYKPRPLVALAKPEPLPPVWPAVRSRTFWSLLFAGGLFASVQLALIIHFVPIVRLQGISLTMATSMAGVIGLFSIAGRIGTGVLLDWVPTRALALFAFTLPLVVMALLNAAHGAVGMLFLAAALLGYAAGSETDVVAFLCSRRFDQRIFGTIYT